MDHGIGRPLPSRIRGPLRRCIWRWPGAPEQFESAQRLTLEIGETEIETLDLASETPIHHRIDLPAERLGDDDTVVLTLNVDGTFVPAEVTGAESGDRRELGAQVFYAFLEEHEEQ